MEFKEIKVSYYDKPNDGVSSINVSDGKVTISFPGGFQYSMEFLGFKYPAEVLKLEHICFDSISKTMPEWIILKNKCNTLEIPKNILRPRKSDDIQLMASLMHITLEVINLDKLENLYGCVLIDNLPPKNKLIIPSFPIQEKIKNEDKEMTLYKTRRLFKLKISLENEKNEYEIYYRPYNVSVILASKLKKIESLNNSLKEEYKNLLKDE